MCIVRACQFPDLMIDCPEVMEPTPGLEIRPRPALQRLFTSVAVDLSRAYFAPFVDKLAQRIESAGGGQRAARSQQAPPGGQRQRLRTGVVDAVPDEL